MAYLLQKNWGLSNEIGEELYHTYAKNLPIIDFHTHLSPQAMQKNEPFASPTALWLAEDHYKWRLMRANGVLEEYITGDASDFEKFRAFVSILPRAAGSPVFHWCAMELAYFFGYDGPINSDTASDIWCHMTEKLQKEPLTPQSALKRCNVSFIATTDDPADTLCAHAAIQGGVTLVTPTFRPDAYLGVGARTWRGAVSRLAVASEMEISDFETLTAALLKRLDVFCTHGCRISDHSFAVLPFAPQDMHTIDKIVKKALRGDAITELEAESVATHLLLTLAKAYRAREMVMQLHLGVLRNPNTKMNRMVGKDSGFDCILPKSGTRALPAYLNALYESDALPRTIVYSLDANENAYLDTVLGSFAIPGVRSGLQHGSAWWFHDHKDGIRAHLSALRNYGVFGNFIGMLTDSRSFTGMVRHDYFRRVLCGLIGEWAACGDLPRDRDYLQTLVRDICYRNAREYFSLSEVLPCV